MNTAIYVRVSSDKQNTASQLPDLKGYATAQEAACAAVSWFEDKASGKKMARPAWDRLMAEVRKGSIKRIVVWRLDRLGRTARPKRLKPLRRKTYARALPAQPFRSVAGGSWLPITESRATPFC
jgi:DNA invertase Pin-like site-specific DNA recombinase